METGLPLLASMGNRSSVSRAYNLFQTTTEPYDTPNILEDFKNDKPLLIMIDTSHINRFPYLEEGTKFLKAVDAMRYFELPLAGFQERILARKQEIITALKADSLLFDLNGFLSTDSLSTFVYNSLDDQKSSKHYKGNGGLELNISNTQEIFKAPIPAFKKGDKVTLSFWANDLSKFPVANTFIHAKLWHPETGELLWQYNPQIRYLLSVMANDGWSLVEMPFELKGTGILEISIENNAMENQAFFVDELLIRKSSTDLYKADNPMFKNNRYYQ